MMARWGLLTLGLALEVEGLPDEHCKSGNPFLVVVDIHGVLV